MPAKKTELIRFRVTPKEKRQAIREAKLSKLDLSGLFRMMLLNRIIDNNDRKRGMK